MMGESDDDELKRLRLEKMQRLLQAKAEAEKRAQQAQRKPMTVDEKLDVLMKVLLQPAAYQYLMQIKKQDEEIYKKIRTQIFPPKILSELDLLMAYFQRGLIRRHVVPLNEIQFLERQARGIGPRITIKKQGKEATDLSSFLKEED